MSRLTYKQRKAAREFYEELRRAGLPPSKALEERRKLENKMLGIRENAQVERRKIENQISEQIEQSNLNIISKFNELQERADNSGGRKRYEDAKNKVAEIREEIFIPKSLTTPRGLTGGGSIQQQLADVSGGVQVGKSTNIVWLPFAIIAGLVLVLLSFFNNRKRKSK